MRNIPQFEQIEQKWDWRPIRGCPGRFILAGGAQPINLSELIGMDPEVTEHHCEGAQDPVLVTTLMNGGLISYKKPHGWFIHTLCNEDGFNRKLAQLGLI